jgi:uncharacterized protein YdhG (YjbR/CyaY superfamily)
MQNKAATVDGYLSALPPDRREALATVRAAILKHLPEGYVETIGFGMIAYVIPLARFPKTYNGQPLMIAALASQKTYMSVHLLNLYGHPPTLKWFVEEFKNAGKKLDMGKGCVRFKSLDDLPIDLIGQTVARCPVDQLIEWHEMSHSPTAVEKRRASRRAAIKPAKAKSKPKS